MAAPKGNKYGLGNSFGRPRKYDTVEELDAKISEYFEWVKGESHTERRKVKIKNKDGTVQTETVEVTVWDREPETISVTGLALYLGFASRQSLHDYSKQDGFSYPIKRALMVIEMEYEEGLRTSSPAGSIFALKNFGWRDQSFIDHTSDGKAMAGHVVTFVDNSKKK